MNPWRWVDPRVRSVRVADVQAYLLGRGWKRKPSPNPKTLIFEEPPIDGGKPFYQVIPASEDFSDYLRHITELITTLSEIEDRHPVELLNDILGQAATHKRPARQPEKNGPNEDTFVPFEVKPRKREKRARSV
jgi:hypothetical protein